MTQRAHKPGPSAATGAHEALVTALTNEGVEIKLVDDGKRAPAERARVAIRGYQPAIGDRVLALRTREDLYIVGEIFSSGAREVRTPAGAAAAVDGERIVVR